MRVPRRTQHEGQAAIAPVLGADEELWTTVLMDVVQPRLLDDAHDGQRLIAERNLRAERAAPGKELRGQEAIDHRFAHALVAALVEPAAGKQPDAHHLHVCRARADAIDERRVAFGVAGDPGRARNGDRVLACRCGERQPAGGAYAHDARYGRKRVLDPLLEREDVGGFREDQERDPLHAGVGVGARCAMAIEKAA